MQKIKTPKQQILSDITAAQIWTIQQRAIALWGDSWLPRLVDAYCKTTETDRTKRFAQVQQWMLGSITPSADNLNALALAVGKTDLELRRLF
jgi:hypothetical protein